MGHLVIRSISTNVNEDNLEVLFIPILEKVASDYNITDLIKQISLLLGYKEYSFVTGVLDNDQYWKMCASLIPSRLCTESHHLANIDELYLSQAPEASMSFQEYYAMKKSEHGQGKS
jgi:hypothetical protein